MSSTLIHSLAILTAVLLLIFSLFAFRYKRGRTQCHKILGAFLLSNTLYIIDFSLNALIDVTGISLQWFNGVGASFGFIFGPLLYLYTKSITEKQFTLKLSYLFHFLIFAIALFIVMFKFSVSALLFYSVLYLQIIPYLCVCFVLLRKYQRTIKNYFSSIDKLSLDWMWYVVGAFFIMWMIDLADFILIYLRFINQSTSIYFVFLSLMINFIFAVLIFYKALQHPEIFTGMAEGEKPKYEHSKLTDAEKSEYLHKLRNYFNYQKPYLDPELTITEVARELNVSVKYLSQVINESLSRNFFDFINSYRIEEAKRQLRNEIESKKTVLEVLYESGFNSKSAFNSAFKKHTGFTPTQFRRQPFIN